MSLRIAGVQMDVTLGEPAANLARMEESLRETSDRGATLTVFPECSLAGYGFESLDEALPYAESIPGPSTERFTALCRSLGGYVVYGLLERASEGRLFNTCVLIGPDGVVGAYRKVHLPYLGVDRFTTSGDRPWEVYDIGPVRIGMNICYDGAFPEASRIMALDGADLIVLPTNWPPGAECTADYVINARALENHVYYMAVNRVGIERGFPFIGRSKICQPDGQTLVESRHDGPSILETEIDVAWARQKRVIRVPKKHEMHRFDDRKPQMYGRIVNDPSRRSSDSEAV